MSLDLNTYIEDFWDTLICDTPEELEQLIQDIERDDTLSAYRHDIYKSSYSGLTPLEYVFDDMPKQQVLQKIYND